MRRFTDAFGKAPASFDAFVEAELAALEKAPRACLRSWPRVALAVCAFALLAVGVAVALSRGVGVFDLVPIGTAAPLMEASAPVAAPSRPPGISTSRVTWHVRDAVMDDQRVMITLDIEPKQTYRYLILPPDATPLTELTSDGETMTYLAMAEKSGKVLLQISPPTISVNGGSGYGGNSSHAMDGGRLVYHAEIFGVEAAEGEPLDVRCSLLSFEVWDAIPVYLDSGDMETRLVRGDSTSSSLRFALEATPAAAATRRYAGPVDSGPVEIHMAELRTTALATYLKVRYSVHTDISDADREWLQDVVYYLVDAPDAQPTGPQSPAVTRFITEPDPNGPYGGAVMEMDTIWPAMADLPQALTLRPYHQGTDTWGEAVVLTEAADSPA